ncbi:hypothetical protein N9F34_01905 [Alphaproteobacteria bacterium]|nr:hypothetical protein [Alphaproteobacteria bacterium]
MNGRDQNISPNRFESHEHLKEVITAPPSHQQAVITRERRLRCCVLRLRIRQGLKGGKRPVPDTNGESLGQQTGDHRRPQLACGCETNARVIGCHDLHLWIASEQQAPP